jgi:hypothetical protein
VIDFHSIDKDTGELWLTIADELPWQDDDDEHLMLLQEKLNTYLRFIESGELYKKIPNVKDRRIAINLVGKYFLNRSADEFLHMARIAIANAGFRLQFSLLQAKQSQ